MTFVTLPISTEEGASPPGLAGGAAALMGWLNGFLQPRRLRRYQSDLFDRGQFAIRDPRDGAERLCDGTICSADKAFAWRFPSEWGELWLTSAGPTHGYEIESVFDPATGRLFLLADRDPRLAHSFARHIQAAGSLPPGSGQAAWLLVGHANFAHFLWNEASALLELETRMTSGIAGVLLSYEPVLPFATLFDWPAAIMRRPVIPAALHGHALGFHVAPIFAVGATRISLAARERVVTRCRMASPQLPATRPDAVRIWLSLRQMYRHPVNQIETFAAFLHVLRGCERPVEILLDGYSLPQDLGVPGRYDVVRERSRQTEAMALARALVQRCGSRIDGPSLIDLTGCSLAEGIAHAGYAQFYICHHGTQQHKIGWLYPTPGLVHTNPSITATQPAGWVADQSEIAVAPAYLPIDLVEHADTVTERPGQSYFADYHFRRPAAAAAAMAGALRRTLSLA